MPCVHERRANTVATSYCINIDSLRDRPRTANYSHATSCVVKQAKKLLKYKLLITRLFSGLSPLLRKSQTALSFVPETHWNAETIISCENEENGAMIFDKLGKSMPKYFDLNGNSRRRRNSQHTLLSPEKPHSRRSLPPFEKRSLAIDRQQQTALFS